MSGSAIRKTVLRVLSASGATTRVKQSGWRRRRLLILCFHGFSLADEHQWNPLLYVSAVHLQRRLTQLRDGGYTVLPLQEALERLYAGTLPPAAVSLTVDDGMFDFHAVGYPILRRAGVPATTYVSTYYVFHQHPVFDVAAGYLLWRAARAGSGALELVGASGPLRLTLEDQSAPAWGRLKRIAAQDGWSADHKYDVLEQLARLAGIDWAELRRSRLLTLMTPEEISGLDRAIVDVQLHTHRHRMPDSREAFLQEVEENRVALMHCGRTREQLRHFCYPSGVYGQRHLPWLREAGVDSATTTRPGLAFSGSDPLQLPRFIDNYLTSDVEFEAWAAGVRAVLRRPARRPTD
jgi:peptidoglycan/xylan/chitin deacetylase (PgdA/CDA1 family)